MKGAFVYLEQTGELSAPQLNNNTQPVAFLLILPEV